MRRRLSECKYAFNLVALNRPAAPLGPVVGSKLVFTRGCTVRSWLLAVEMSPVRREWGVEEDAGVVSGLREYRRRRPFRVGVAEGRRVVAVGRTGTSGAWMR